MRKNTDQKNSEYEQLSSNWVGGRKVDEKSDKKSQRKEGCTAKMITLTKILLCSFFCNLIFSFFISHEAVIILQQATRKTNPKANLCISDNYEIFSQKCCISTTS